MKLLNMFNWSFIHQNFTLAIDEHTFSLLSINTEAIFITKTRKYIRQLL